MLSDLFSSLGFTNEEYIKIRRSYPIITFKDETLYNNILKINKFLLRIGYTNIKNMVIKYPALYSFSLDYLNVKIGYLLNNYTKKEIIKMTSKTPMIFGLKNETMDKKIKDMNKYFSKEEFIKMTKVNPELYTVSIDSINKKMNFLLDFGFKKEELIKMIKILPNILTYDLNSIKDKLDYMKSLGFTKEEIIHITRRSPSIFSHNKESIKEKIDLLKDLEFTDITKIIRKTPTILSLSNNSIKYKYLELLNYFAKEDTIYILENAPFIFTFTITKIKQKLDFYKNLGLLDMIKEKPQNLMQSIDLTKERLEYFSNNNIDINMDNYKLLFLEKKKFSKKFTR